MKHYISTLGAASLCALLSTAVAAQSPAPAQPYAMTGATEAMTPRSAWFFGAGGAYNQARLKDQTLYAQGVSDIFLDGKLYAWGQAGGSLNPEFNSKSTASPVAQLGYKSYFGGSNWLWGAKLSYNYLSANAEAKHLLVPQYGSFTSPTPADFTGNVLVRSYETRLRHQMTLMPFVGYGFDRLTVYAGAGVSLAQASSDLKGVIGFAAINSQHIDVTGQALNFSSSQWILGTAATIGLTYALSREWFVDGSYTWARMAHSRSAFAGPFSSGTDGYNDTGILSGAYRGRVSTQSFMVSLNRAF